MLLGHFTRVHTSLKSTRFSQLTVDENEAQRGDASEVVELGSVQLGFGLARVTPSGVCLVTFRCDPTGSNSVEIPGPYSAMEKGQEGPAAPLIPWVLRLPESSPGEMYPADKSQQFPQP